MKTKVLNFVMPVFVFIMAIGLAFATEKADDGQTGHYLDPDTGMVRDVEVDCDSSDIKQCEYNGNPVFVDENLEIPMLRTAEQ